MNQLENTTLLDIAKTHGTPTYVYDLDTVSAQLERLRLAVPGAQIHYAVKANPSHAVLKHLAGQGLGVEAITLGELERALTAGFPAEKVLLGGPGQDEVLIARACEAGVGLISLDSTSQLELWDNANLPGKRFLVRINPALDPRTHEHLATGAAESKFGMPLEEAVDAAKRLLERDRLAGFHIHAGSQIDEIGVYDEVLALLKPLYERFPEATILDIGGGFAVPGFPLEAFATRVRGFAKQLGLQLIIEPGRYLAAPAGVLLTRVRHVKDGPIKHVIADAGMADLVRPALYGAAHPIRLLAADADSRTPVVVDVDGPLCENADRLGRGVTLPCPQRGDLLVVEQAGAYGLTMASNYASSLRPAEVVVTGGEVRLVRRRETVADLLRLEEVSEAKE